MSAESATKILSNKEVIFASYPTGWITEDNFGIRESEFFLILKPGSKDIVLKTLWVSLDPYIRELMSETKTGLDVALFQLGKPIKAPALFEVIVSDNPSFEEGHIVYGVANVADYVLIPGGEGIEKIDPNVAPLTYYLGILGMPGHTAWVGINLLAQPKPGDQVYITTAAGAVGLVAGQLAKLKGCRVVGSAGSDDKVRLLQEEFGFDDAFNYKEEKDWDVALSKYFPKGIDIYFENVGGQMLEAVLNHINFHGRIAVCGMVSQYNKALVDREGPRNLLNIVGKCVKMEGFLINYYFHTRSAFRDEVISYIQQGKLKYKEHILNKGIENFPKTYIGMLKGENIGKALLHVADIGVC